KEPAARSQTSHGLRRRTSVVLKSLILRVTTVRPCTCAVAAINASRLEQGLGTWKLAQALAIAKSIGRMRPAKAGSTWPSSQARSSAPCRGSLRCICSTPVSSSMTVITDRYCVMPTAPLAHAETLALTLAVPILRSSDTTLVSRRCIRPQAPSREIRRLENVIGHAWGIKFDRVGIGHCQQFADTRLTLGETLIFFDGQQHVGRMSSVGNEHGAVACRFLSAAGILVEFPAGKGGGHRDCSIMNCRNVTTIQMTTRAISFHNQSPLLLCVFPDYSSSSKFRGFLHVIAS